MFVCGQGRALLTQRFRPAFPSIITICSQDSRMSVTDANVMALITMGLMFLLALVAVWRR